MRLPLGWLREYVAFEVEPRRLADELTAVGLAVDTVERVGAETVLDLDITTNRVDCMNVYGVAREVAALYGLPLRPPAMEVVEQGPPAQAALEVVLEAPDLCGRFCARLLEVRVGPSPAWLRDRLELMGVRSISNVVDLTNYVMLELGQPSHAFDLARIAGGQLVVRWSRAGEPLTTLDGVARSLPARVGVIAGRAGEPALALAGIMGGASSEISDETRTLALEAAWWEPLAVRRAARSLGMHTEASHRFERGADPEAGPVAILRLAHLLARLGAGSLRPGLIECRGNGRPARTLPLRPRRVSALLGAEVPEERQTAVLGALGFGVERRGAELEVRVPSWRLDVAGEADLAEEVGRHFGVQRIAPRLPPASCVGSLRLSQRRERRLRDVLTGAGLSEVINYPFASGAQVAAAGAEALRLANPLSEEQDTLRTSLAVPGLLEVLRTNLRQGRRDLAIFELGRVFVPASPQPREERRLAVLVSGAALPSHWSAPGRAFDFFDLGGLVELLFARLGEPLPSLAREGPLPGYLHPGRAAAVVEGGSRLGHLGALHPDLRRAFDLRDEALVLELVIEELLERPRPPVRVASLDRYPEVQRDLSILCEETALAAEIVARVRAAGGARLRGLSVVDRYTGGRLGAGRLSLTLSLRFQDPERTLTGEEVQAAMNEIVRALRSAGLEIRGE